VVDCIHEVIFQEHQNLGIDLAGAATCDATNGPQNAGRARQSRARVGETGESGLMDPSGIDGGPTRRADEMIFCAAILLGAVVGVGIVAAVLWLYN